MVLEPEKLRRKAITFFDAITAPASKRVYLDPDFSDDLVIQILGGEVKATSILTLTANLSDGDLVRIGTLSRGLVVYKAQTVLTNVANNFLIGATASVTIDNLIAAIILASGAGTLFAAATEVHPDVTAVAGAGDTMDVTAKRGGTSSNAIVTTETSGTASWTSGTLASGTDFTGTLEFKTAMDDVEFEPIEATDLGDGTTPTSATAPGIFRLKVGGMLVILLDVTALSAGDMTVLGYHRGLARG